MPNRFDDHRDVPSTLVERIAATLPLLCAVIAVAAPIIASVTDRAPIAKMGKAGTVPAAMIGFLFLHLAWLLGRRFEVLWSGDYYIGLATQGLCMAGWLVAFILITSAAK